MATTQTTTVTKKKSAPLAKATKVASAVKKALTGEKSNAKKTTVTRAKSSPSPGKTTKGSVNRSAKPKTKTADPEQFPISAAHAGESVAHEVGAAEDRYVRIQNAAYLIAEKDGFQAGREQDYWLQAEQEINQQA